MLAEPKAHADPPTPPGIDRRLQFHRTQLWLLPLMWVVPALALFGQLGGGRERAAVERDGVRLAAEFSGRDHLEDWSRIHVTVANRSPARLSAVQVEFSRALLDPLWRPTFNPEPARIDGEWYVVPLGDIPPGESRALTLDYRSMRAGRLSGAIRARAGEAELAQLPISILVLP